MEGTEAPSIHCGLGWSWPVGDAPGVPPWSQAVTPHPPLPNASALQDGMIQGGILGLLLFSLSTGFLGHLIQFWMLNIIDHLMTFKLSQSQISQRFCPVKRQP